MTETSPATEPRLSKTVPTGSILGTHPVGNLFPPMSEDEYTTLCDDIREHGQREPIWLSEGLIVDGRHRFKACKDLGIDAQVREWDGRGSLVSFVASLNLTRRHLTSSQRAMIALDILPYLEEEAKERQRAAAKQTNAALGRGTDETLPVNMPEASAYSGEAREQAAKLAGTGARYVSTAKTLRRTAPGLAAQVQRGEVSIPAAMGILRTRAKPTQPTAEYRSPEARVRSLMDTFVRAIDHFKNLSSEPRAVGDYQFYAIPEGLDEVIREAVTRLWLQTVGFGEKERDALKARAADMECDLTEVLRSGVSDIIETR